MRLGRLVIFYKLTESSKSLLRKYMNNIKHAKIKYCKYSEIRQNIRAEMLLLLRVSIS